MAMDKLQPIIKHHFWIVFLIALMLPPIAWWMTTGELAAEISERTSSLDSTFSGIADGRNAANDDWANGVNELIGIRTKSNTQALDMLWKAQTDLMVWPSIVAEDMAKCPYRGEVDDVKVKQVLPAWYREGYEQDVRRVWHIPEPIDDGKTRVDQDAKQKVVFPYESLPRIAASKWEGLPPTWQEIWNAQEDLWLLSEVLSAVRETNSSTSSITDSYVKQIMQVQLFGGKRAAAPSSAGGTTASAINPGMPGMPGMSRGAARRGGASPLSRPAEFPISEEYDVPSSGGSSYGLGESGSTSVAPAAAADPNSDDNRYVQSEEAYRTRGFKLKVAIDQMQVPTLIRELLNSQYPIEIIRFQQSAMNPEEPGKPASRNSTYPGGNSLAGASSGYPASGDGEFDYSNEQSSGLGESSTEDFGFDGKGAGGDALSGQAYAVPAIANVKASLEERDLVELVVIGEIYIYNPPAVDETAADAANPTVGGSAPPATAETPASGIDGPAIPPETTTTETAAPVVTETPATSTDTVPESAAAPAEEEGATAPTDASPPGEATEAGSPEPNPPAADAPPDDAASPPASDAPTP
ncbi:MAG: hypothetical protein ACI8P0_005809 [Planctomycetaceae bacterium]|jgi:hypothetical protein